MTDPAASDCPWIGVEGPRTIFDLTAFGKKPRLVVRSSEAGPAETEAQETEVVSPSVFAGLSATRSPQGVLAFFEKPQWQPSDLTDCILYLDHLADPGNLGTLLRTAAATGIFSLVTSPGSVHRFNDKVVRASAGALFRVPFLEGRDLADVASNRTIWAGVPWEGRDLFEAELQPPLVLLLGSEARGISADLDQQAVKVSIPMQKGWDSLNAAVAGSLLMYEVFRKANTG